MIIRYFVKSYLVLIYEELYGSFLGSLETWLSWGKYTVYLLYVWKVCPTVASQ